MVGLRLIVASFVVAFGLWLGGGATACAQAADISVAVIDVRALLAKSAAGKSLQAQLDQRREAFQKDFADTEKRLQKTGQDIAGQRASLPAADFEKKKKSFEEDVAKSKKRLEDRKQGLDKAFIDSVNQIRAKIISLSTDLARERGYQLVVSRENVIVVDKGLDVTQEVLARMDKTLPDLKLPAGTP